MKEATGEANMTVVTVVLIGVVAAIGAVLIPRLMDNVQDRACCNAKGGHVEGRHCKLGPTLGADLNGYRSRCE